MAESAAIDLRRIADMHAVYRMFDPDGRLLYVGVTGRVGARFRDHSDKRWFLQVATIRLEWSPTRAAAMLAERRAIDAERPRYNIVGNGRRSRAIARRPASPPPAPAAPETPVRRPSQMALSEAVRAKVVTGTLAAARIARWRDPDFPAVTGKRGNQVFLYSTEELLAWNAKRLSRAKGHR